MDDSTESQTQPSGLAFLNSDLNASITAAAASGRPLFCLVTDETSESVEWEAAVREEKYRRRLSSETITLRIATGTTEYAFLNGVCALESMPAIIIIRNGQIEHNFQSASMSVDDLSGHLESMYGSEDNEQSSPVRDTSPISNTAPTSQQDAAQYISLGPSAGRMRLPNNAYDALSVRTQKLVDQKIRADMILRLQMRWLRNIPALQDTVKALESRTAGESPELSEDTQQRLLNTPASALGFEQSSAPTAGAGPQNRHSSSAPRGDAPQTSRASIPSQASNNASEDSSTQSTQRSDYIRQQREREAAQKAERERIKSQIKADHEERRRLEELRKQSERATELSNLRQQNSTTAKPASTDIRVQVRTFDGSTIRTTFVKSATISKDVRPWIDTTANLNTPYNLKLLLTPQPNRNIEATEEELELLELGIVGSTTMIMVPVKGFVDSYTGSSGGLFGTLTGAAGSVLGGIGSVLGWGGASAGDNTTERNDTGNSVSSTGGQGSVKVRTLADQRAEEAAKQSNELYNGNQLNFQGKKDKDDGKDE